MAVRGRPGYKVKSLLRARLSVRLDSPGTVKSGRSVGLKIPEPAFQHLPDPGLCSGHGGSLHMQRSLQPPQALGELGPPCQGPERSQSPLGVGRDAVAFPPALLRLFSSLSLSPFSSPPSPPHPFPHPSPFGGRPDSAGCPFQRVPLHQRVDPVTKGVPILILIIGDTPLHGREVKVAEGSDVANQLT